MSALSKLITLPLSGKKKNEAKKASLKATKKKNHNSIPVELIIDIESPPCVLYGNANESTGCLLSGLLTVKVKDLIAKTKNSTVNKLTSLNVRSLKLSFIQRVSYNKPFSQGPSTVINCKDCNTRKQVLKTWNIVENSTTLDSGSTQIFPFSHLISGKSTVTCYLGSNSDTKVRYELIASIRYFDNSENSQSKNLEPKLVTVKLPIMLTRSILRGPDKNSLRVFPPTNLTTAAVLPSVVYPKSTFPLEMKLEGISGEDTRWRMRKLSYRIEETVRIRNNVCEKHVEDLKVLENVVKEKEVQKSKKPPNPIKRYGDLAPQVRLSVNTIGGSSSSHNNGARSALNTPQSVANNSGDRDEDDEEMENSSTFVHPNDDVARQEILQQRQRIRKEEIEAELQNETSLFTEEVRIIAEGIMKSGWKTDFNESGKIEIVTDIDCSSLNSGVSNSITHASSEYLENEMPKAKSVNVSCDIQDPVLGINVSHILSVEMVVAEEALQYKNGQPVRHSNSSAVGDSASKNSSADQRLAELSPMLANRNSNRRKNLASTALSKVASINSNNDNKDNSSDVPIVGGDSSSKTVGIPTGAARVLRMQFRVNVTERSGLGISWDEEVPPIYQNVSFVSPPSYDNLDGVSTRHAGSESAVYDNSEMIPLNSTDFKYSTLDLERPVQIYNQASTNALSAIQSLPLESVESIDGSDPTYHNSLTPRQTRDIRIPTISEVIDTDKITQ
ncbi:hypothetical protein TPHA_0H02710 [Tetrapisispora phaffii CBS 4417]|uniref:LDB19 N-terminal domain-containing protein n=1 Tax=Tetrapisispora phaffii (strain ATCC 24235 / CBS 4417 / NBRC 1672 / NRRL Y-8282 / UCD 70-5) TaxID=1071381 RepID=G8BWM3_TETPH|nr:hypothetical protein TPHA_0H02710 [Tetrapisispora phaffii CBS 4417]CCE64474.1 hypothetical protein TPHA_0H02710 [Tetrapisispora phaffii CBS 4417]